MSAEPTGSGSSTRLDGRGSAPWWSGLPFAGSALVLWVAVAMYTPTTTYHFAPAIVAGAWPAFRRLRAGRALAARAALATTAASAALAVGATAVLHALGAMAGPTFFSPDGAAFEAFVMAAIGAVAGFAIAVTRGKLDGH